jgi:DNA-binding CsgD family transcriptional regulator/tetratricopeptide (TPR) repeat protein
MELFERETFLDALASVWDEARTDSGRIALISGEAGIGKTVLVEAFTRRLNKKAPVYWGACDPLFTPQPLGPLHDISSRLPGNLSSLLAEGTRRTAIFSAFLDVIQRDPAIFVFDDIHWADEATLDLLRYIGRRISQTTALLVLTYRDDELGARHPLRSLLGDLAASAAVRRFPLSPLSEKGVRALAGDSRLDVRALFRQTGGNPFFVSEVLANPGGAVPLTIRDAVLARAGRLSPAGRRVLYAAAVAGPRIEPGLLAEMTSLENNALEECLEVGMLVSQSGFLAFRHELARQIVHESIPIPERQKLHHQALDLLKESPATRRDLSRLAHHAEAAADGSAVLEYAPAAARQAEAASAHREAAALYILALRYADRLQPDEHANLLQSYAQVCNATDNRMVGIEMLRKALEIWRALNNAILQGAVLAQMANMLVGLGNSAEAQECSQEAIRILEAYSPGHELAQAYRVQAGIDMINHDSRQAIAWAEKSLAIALPLEDMAEVYLNRNMIGSSMMTLDFELGCHILEENLAAANNAGYMTTAVHAYAQLGSISAELYHFRRAERYLKEGLDYAFKHDLDRLKFYMMAWLAFTYIHLGHWREAEEEAKIVLSDARWSTTSRLMALAGLGLLRVRQGDPQAAGFLDDALKLSSQMTGIDRLGPVRLARMEMAWGAGDLHGTMDEARAAYDLAVDKQQPWFAGAMIYWAWRAGERVTVPDWVARPYALQIAGDWRSAADEWARLGCPYEQARALAEGDSDARVNALEIFENLGALPAAKELRQRLQADGVANLPRKPRASTLKNPFGLTNRQVDILYLLIDGLSNAEIAARMHISLKTTDHHVSAILARLNVHSREAAAGLALAHPYFQKK